jgi:hypothetical protein
MANFMHHDFDRSIEDLVVVWNIVSFGEEVLIIPCK